MMAPEPLSDLTIRPLEGWPEYRACVELQERTWGAGFGEAVPPTILRLTQELGGVASGAFDASGRLLGFVFGMTGWVGNRPVHWSDMLAVHPDARDRGIGERLKRHQRSLLLQVGVTLARWTFDPLEARNARLNLSRLGGTAREYRRDYYGESVSVLHQGVGTDRLIVDWALDSPRVVGRLDHSDPPLSAASLSDIPVVNSPIVRSGVPECEDARLGLEGEMLAVTIPSDIQALKRVDPGLARRWRATTRAAFEAYLGRGYVVSEFIRSGAFGFYVLER